ncbi:MAG: phytanoyl-CoA dioxygenase family protein [Planctomycetes bacterium]|nr:phytanoyl-CoA dioxygenase family protein [Planctomycetota bacterium]
MTPGAAREVFEAEGWVRVPGAVARADVDAMRAALLETLAARGLLGEGLVEVAGALRPGPGSEGVLWEVGRGPAFAPLPGALAGAVDGVFGPGAWAPVEGQHGGLAAPNFPLPGVWSVPHEAWHVDEPSGAGRAGAWGLLGFALLDEVAPGGGATVLIAGSHRRLLALADERAAPGALLTTDEALAALAAAEDWFADLLRPGDPAARRRRFMDEGHVSAGVSLRVVEVTGAPGDVVLMDPRCLHTVSANVSPRARLQMRLVCQRRR